MQKLYNCCYMYDVCVHVLMVNNLKINCYIYIYYNYTYYIYLNRYQVIIYVQCGKNNYDQLGGQRMGSKALATNSFYIPNLTHANTTILHAQPNTTVTLSLSFIFWQSVTFSLIIIYAQGLSE